MQNTSMGFHTFSIFQKTSETEYTQLGIDFMLHCKEDNELQGFPIKNERNQLIGKVYFYKRNKGILWKLFSVMAKNGFIIQGVAVIINPKVLIECNYIRAAQENDIKVVEKLYNEEAAKISPHLLKFNLCSLNRADHCLNIDLKELGLGCSPKQMMVLIKRGNIPKDYKELERYNKTGHRKVTEKNSFYLESNSVVINCYWKYSQQGEEHPNYKRREKSRYVVRFEVQCKYPKLYAVSRNVWLKSKWDELIEEISDEVFWDSLDECDCCLPAIPSDIMLSARVSEDIIQKYFYKVIRKGDYFTLDLARNIVESYGFRREKEERMIGALEIINKLRGISKVKSKLSGLDLDDFKRSLRDLDDILVNPVTIPREWKIRHILNPLSAYYDAFYEEQVVSYQEYFARKRITKFLNKMS